MKNGGIARFIESVKNSTLLSVVQKQELLDRPELLPEAYRDTIIRILERFEDQQRARYRHMATATDALIESLAGDLDENGINQNEKQRVIAQAKSALYPVLSAPAA